MGFGEGVSDAEADGDGEAVGDGDTVGDGDGDDVADGVNVTTGVGDPVSSGSGVKLGADDGACVPLALLPKKRVRSPPSSRPPKITRTTRGTIGTPPRLGGSGSRRRRRG